MDPSDESLIARVLTRDDRHAFATLLRRHQDPVRRLLRRLTGGDEALADDLAQEAFLRAYRGLAGFAGRAKFSSWLYRIAYNVFLNERRAPLVAMDLDALPAMEPERDPISTAHLEKAMLGLRPEERLSLALFYTAGMSPQEIGDVLDCPEGTVKTHLHRGKEKLRETLEVPHD